MFKDSGLFDTILDVFENLIPTIFSNILDSLKKNKNILKFIVLLGFTIRIVYRIYFLNIKEETVNLHYKLISSIFNLIVIKYIIIKDILKKKKK
mgnify:CR=1 FL=1